MFDTILFDLDGTLTDPFEGISNSIIYALKKVGIAAPKKTLLKKIIGPPLTGSFSKYCGLSCSDALRAVEYYRSKNKRSKFHRRSIRIWKQGRIIPPYATCL